MARSDRGTKFGVLVFTLIEIGAYLTAAYCGGSDCR